MARTITDATLIRRLSTYWSSPSIESKPHMKLQTTTEAASTSVFRIGISLYVGPIFVWVQCLACYCMVYTLCTAPDSIDQPNRPTCTRMRAPFSCRRN